MSRVENSGLAYYQSGLLLKSGIDNFFLTRAGGESRGPFAELNLSYRVGDDPRLVDKNYARLKKVLGLNSLAVVHQVHGARILDLDEDKADGQRLQDIEADGIITRQEQLALGVLVADCFPLILAEPKAQVLAVAHCGWRGTLAGVVENALQAINAKGGRVENMVGALGPGICPECYQVDDAVINQFQKRFPQGENTIWKKRGDNYQLDLKAAILTVLKCAGLKSAQLEVLKLCTCCRDEFFSHRRSRGRTGRQIALAMLK